MRKGMTCGPKRFVPGHQREENLRRFQERMREEMIRRGLATAPAPIQRKCPRCGGHVTNPTYTKCDPCLQVLALESAAKQARRAQPKCEHCGGNKPEGRMAYTCSDACARELRSATLIRRHREKSSVVA